MQVTASRVQALVLSDHRLHHEKVVLCDRSCVAVATPRNFVSTYELNTKLKSGSKQTDLLVKRRRSACMLSRQVVAGLN